MLLSKVRKGEKNIAIILYDKGSLRYPVCQPYESQLFQTEYSPLRYSHNALGEHGISLTYHTLENLLNGIRLDFKN